MFQLVGQLLVSIACSKLGILGPFLLCLVPFPFGIFVILILWWNVTFKTKRPWLYAYLLYYVVSVAVLQVVRLGMCKVKDALGPMVPGAAMGPARFAGPAAISMRRI